MDQWVPCKQIFVHRNQVFDPVLSSLSLSSKVTFVKNLINISNNGETGSAMSLSPLRLNAPQGHNGG